MKEFIDRIIYEPWPWYIGGPLIGLFTIALLLIQRKQLGISSSFNYICAGISPVRLDYLKENVQKNAWQFWFVIGLILGGILLFQLGWTSEIQLSEDTQRTLESIGVTDFSGYVPSQLFNFSLRSALIVLSGGVLIGFGARYANGCTAGHAIMGSSQLAPASILATIAFFAGGLLATYLILPYLF